MIHHLSLGVRDLALAGAFHDAALGALGLRRGFEDGTAIGSLQGAQYYAAFLVDPDGYRIEAVCKAPA